MAGELKFAGMIYPAKSGKIELIDLLKEQINAGYQPHDRKSITLPILDRVLADLDHGVMVLDELQRERERIFGQESALRRLQEERDNLYGYVNGLLGLLQMLRGRDDVSDSAKEVMRANHRAADAGAYLTQIVPPKAEAS